MSDSSVMAPFTIAPLATTPNADPAEFRAGFAAAQALHLRDVFAPALLARIMANAASASFIDDFVERIGTREIEAPQRVGGVISMLLGRTALYDWLEAATGLGPIRSVSGRLVQTRANGADELAWHDDLGIPDRLLAVVIDLSDQAYSGGRFELRRLAQETPIFERDQGAAGTMTVFAVRRGLEHRVMPLTAGGPRRVYTGWFLSRPERTLAQPRPL